MFPFCVFYAGGWWHAGNSRGVAIGRSPSEAVQKAMKAMGEEAVGILSGDTTSDFAIIDVEGFLREENKR